MNTPQLAQDIANNEVRVVSIFMDGSGNKWALAYQSDDQETVWAAYPEADSSAYQSGLICVVGMSPDEVKTAAEEWR